MLRDLVLFIFLSGTWNTGILEIPVRVGLFYDVPVSSAVISFPEKGYLIHTSNSSNPADHKGGSIHVTLVDQEIWIRNKTGIIGRSRQIRMVPLADSAVIRIRPVVPMGTPREYHGHILIDQWNGFLRIINETTEDQYVAAVAEAEAGMGSPMEFLKTQCIISRTFYYGRKHVHASEGFSVCDGTHCQVYKGRSRHPGILNDASRGTAGMVIFDRDGMLIEAAYHSNSGGEVLASELLWTTSKPYLRSKDDPWSETGPNYHWERRMPVSEWISYLLENGIAPGQKSHLNFSQSRRRLYYVVGNDSLSFRQIREDLELRSAFFDVEVRDDQVVLSGRGYGHGIGLSQEGGMEMARRGYWFPEIIQYYYPGVTVKRFSSR
jgi:stage II sporulation protein D